MKEIAANGNFLHLLQILLFCSDFCYTANTMTNYYYMATEPLSNTWGTAKIENYLLSFDFLHKHNGNFDSQSPYLNISLMKVRDKKIWSSQNYNKEETNYVSIITSVCSEQETVIKNILKGLEKLLGSNIYPED